MEIAKRIWEKIVNKTMKDGYKMDAKCMDDNLLKHAKTYFSFNGW